MDPYRTVDQRSAADAPRDSGIVGDVIAQFADPLAFYRELVQNAIDAGSPTVEVRIAHDPDAGVARVSVRDRGEGMTRDILENQLLVLFRSTKEHDATKIGKFGIGFASVFAPSPRIVVIRTVRDGARLVVHLYPDLRYEVYDTGRGAQPGTVVELELAMAAGDVGTFVQKSREALERWCRHALVPIDFAAQLPDGTAVAARIDRPLGFDDAHVAVTRHEGQLTVVIGLGPVATPYVGFFNHGLMLHETSEWLVGNVRAKIQDARLGHTLSRDDVRRDAAFERAVRFAQRVAARDLPQAAAVALHDAAEAGGLARHQLLANAIELAGIHLAPEQWRFPIIEPIVDARDLVRSISGNTLGRVAWCAARTSTAAEVLAAAGVPVLATLDAAWLARFVHDQLAVDVAAADSELTCVAPVARDDGDEALLAELAAVLAAVYRAPANIVLARLDGALASSFAIAGRNDPGSDARYVIDRAEAARNPLGRVWFARPPLVVSADHAYYRAARACDPRLGASHLARLLLLRCSALEVARSTALVERTLDALLSRAGSDR